MAMAEKKYIEREAVVELFNKWADGYSYIEVPTKDAIACVRTIPAADVRPVVKARWVYTDMSRLVCSKCGNPVAFALKDDGWHHGDFCPNCGADMRNADD